MTAVALLAVALLACLDLSRRLQHRPTHLLFACALGTALATGIILTARAMLGQSGEGNAFAAALALLLLAMCWRALFGPWEVQTKVAVLGTFVFWLVFAIVSRDAPEQRVVRLIAAGTALVPAAIWCRLFLKYHAQRFGTVALMFLSGMLATVPILFYDALVRHRIEFQFFLFRITPESFSQSSSAFVAGNLAGGGALRTTLLSAFVSFLIVGVIEELSKFWVLRRSGAPLFASIDDVLQLSIVVAIGFAFAENIVNPTYFVGFVREYLTAGAVPDVRGFLSNVLGRSILTSMVHIVATGVLGYFLGLAIFAGPYLKERHAQGYAFRITRSVHALLRLPEDRVFRTQMLMLGIFGAILLHAAFNFLVTIPEMLPGNPQTLGSAFGMEDDSFFHRIPLLLPPALLYVVGGFWLLTGLFLKKENAAERGHLLTREEFISDLPAS